MTKKLIVPVTVAAALVGGAVARWAPASLTTWLAPDRALLAHRPFLLLGVLALAVFNLYWEAEAKKAAPARSKESDGSRAVHVVLVNVAVLLVIVPIHGLGRCLPVSGPAMAVGLAVEGAGIFLAVWARRHLGRHWSGAIAINEGHELVRSGPYGRLRHPIYTGLLLMYGGLAIVFGEWFSLIGLAAAVAAYVRKVRLEEARLSAEFGGTYEAYRKASWGLMPGIY